MIRKLVAFLVLLAFAGAGVGLLRLGEETKLDETVLEWSNVLVSRNLPSVTTPEFSRQTVRPGASPSRWWVVGEVTLSRQSGERLRRPYEAVVRRTCDSLTREQCWTLDWLATDGQILISTDPDAAGAGALGLGTMPAPEPEAMDGAEGSLPTTGIGAEPAVPSSAGDAVAPEPSSPAPAAPETESGEVQVDISIMPAEDGQSAGTEPEPASLPELQPEPAPAAEPAASETPPEPAETQVTESPATDTETAEPPPEPAETQTSETQGTQAQTAARPDPEDEGPESGLVLLLQDRLNRLGYGQPTLLKVNGRLNARTREAIFSYQVANRLKPDGLPSDALLNHMEKRIRTPAAAIRSQGVQP